MTSPTATIEALGPQHRDGLVALFQADAQCRSCWCMNHRLRPAALVEGEAARDALLAGIGAGTIHGLVARDPASGALVGWLAVDPFRTLVGHDCHPELRGGPACHAPPRGWAIHCLMIAPAWRGRGLAGRMIEAAADYARSQGAQVLLAWPLPAGVAAPDGDRFGGPRGHYERLGYVAGEVIDGFYQQMALPLVELPTRRS